ncbi:DUF4839 domain-containing protein [Streptomyces sp. HNS054]|uniref:DUF4839 domain-containing protein n=1 Tax=Streptomyces sp. HNS054 TaxID=1662446 RepID=UPI000652F139|nr:DUF4839 domain-containing protein [Streptomyces sp. HNS054]WPW22483.1 DUF4839 domain-containing protein [Streptomyces griseoincarnatus]
MADEIKYEYKTVQTVRGTDGLVISKMRKDGWEVVEQSQGALRSTLTFRRPKKPLPWPLVGTGAAVLAIIAVVIGTAAALSDGDEQKDEAAKPAAGASEEPSATPTPTAAERAAVEVITPENNSELAALLKASDTCDEANADFAIKYAGRTIAFNGSIVNMAPHGDYETRYDFLLGPGDNGSNTTVGPAFQYEDVNVAELSLTGKDVPAALGVGDKFRFVAQVVDFNAVQCLFHLDPVSTETR